MYVLLKTNFQKPIVFMCSRLYVQHAMVELAYQSIQFPREAIFCRLLALLEVHTVQVRNL